MRSNFWFRQHEKTTTKNVADFQSYMIKRLKDDREDVIQSAREIVENSRANMNNQTRIHNAILLLLEATSFQDFIHTMTMDFAAMLDVDIISLVIEIDAGVHSTNRYERCARGWTGARLIC